MANNQDIKKLYSLLHKLCVNAHMDLDETKKYMVLEVSQGRTEHSKELYDNEFNRLIWNLEHSVGNISKPGDRTRKSIMSMCYTMNIITNTMSNTDKLREIDSYIANHTKIGNKKKLMDYSNKELNKLHHQFEVFTKYYLSKIA